MSAKICSSCKLNDDNLVKLPFKLICETCITKQCTADTQEMHLTMSQLACLNKKLQDNYKSTPNEENLGVKLYKIKEDLADFFTNMNQFESRIV